MILDNIRSAHNVGSVFRTSDSFGIDFVALCGICAVPPSAEIHKSALGAEEAVPWKHYDDTLSAVEDLRKQGYTIISVEQTERAVDITGLRAVAGQKTAYIFGNEVDGVRQDVVDASDHAVVIPQFGTKHSLNVSVCAGVVLWEACKFKNNS